MAAEVRALVELHGIKRISEEMTAEGLERYEVDRTIAGTVADELNVEYEHIDLARADSAAISLTDAPALKTIMSRGFTGDKQIFQDALGILADEVRERVWVHRILLGESWPVLFICGSEHVVPVTRLWQKIGLPQAIAHRDFAA